MSAEEIIRLYGLQSATDLQLMPMSRVDWRCFFKETDDYLPEENDVVEVLPEVITISREATGEMWTWNKFFCSIAQWAWLFNHSVDVFDLIKSGKAKEALS